MAVSLVEILDDQSKDGNCQSIGADSDQTKRWQDCACLGFRVIAI
jgi:hypothetical protein